MYRLLTGVLLLLPLTVTAADAPADTKGGLKENDNLPGVFMPYNVTGPYKGRYHCLISDYSLEPTVMLFVRDLEVSNPLKELLKQLDERIASNPAVRLHAFVVFVSSELPDVVTNDDKRDEMAKKLEDLSNSLALKNVVFCLDSPKDVEKYVHGEDRATAILFRKYRVVSAYTLPKGDEADTLAKILADVGAKLRAAKTK
jgi:hypothetical protein